jgi:hypothetical protein
MGCCSSFWSTMFRAWRVVEPSRLEWARLQEPERALRLEVLSKFGAWRISVARANLSADKLAVRFSKHAAMNARVTAGTVTATDLLKAFEQVNDVQANAVQANAVQANAVQVDLLEENHAVVIAKSDLDRDRRIQALLDDEILARLGRSKLSL